MVYTRYILPLGIYMVYTWYIPTMYLVGVPDECTAFRWGSRVNAQLLSGPGPAGPASA